MKTHYCRDYIMRTPFSPRAPRRRLRQQQQQQKTEKFQITSRIQYTNKRDNIMYTATRTTAQKTTGDVFVREINQPMTAVFFFFAQLCTFTVRVLALGNRSDKPVERTPGSPYGTTSTGEAPASRGTDDTRTGWVWVQQYLHPPPVGQRSIQPLSRLW